MSSDSFGARSTLEVGGRAYEIFRLDALAGALRRRPPALLDQGPAGERAAARGRRLGQRRRRRGDRRLGRGGRAQRRDPLPAGAGADAGLHRRPRRRRPGGDARRDGGDRRRPGGDQPAGRRRPGDRPLGPGRRLRQRARLRRQRRARVRAQPRALLVPQVGPARPSTTSASCRRRPASATRSTSSTSPRSSTAARTTASCRPTPTPWSAPTRTRRWSTASACSAGASAGSRPRRRCSASRSRCCCRRSSASSSAASCREGATATDLVLTVTEMLRERGVVSKFVEFFGPGLATLGLADRATLGNMSPEFGSTCAIFPVDAETLRYLELTGRPTETIELVDAYAREQGMFHDERSPDPVFSDLLELDLGEVVPSIAGPKRPQDRVPLAAGQGGLPRGDGGVRPRGRRADGQRPRRGDRRVLPGLRPAGRGPRRRARQAAPGGRAAPRRRRSPHGSGDAIEVTLEDGTSFELDHGRVVIAAITSCTNTSNPSVMVGAGLLARNAVEARPRRASPG